MKSLKKQRRIQVIFALLVTLALSITLLYFALPKGLFQFRSPTQVLEEPPRKGEVFRIGGLVLEGSLIRGAGTSVTFSVTDTNAVVPVSYTGVLPDLFEENQGMIGTGTLENNVFIASEILAKHDESYMPKEVVDALKEQGVYQPTAE